MVKEEKLLEKYLYLANCYRHIDTAKQIEILEMAEKHFPPSYETYMELALPYEMIKPQKYLALLMQAKEIDATPDVLTYLAAFYNYALKDAVNGAKYYKLALEHDPDDYWLWSDYYDCKYRHISKIEADKLLRKIEDEIKETSNTKKLIAYLEISQIYRALKNPQKQLEYLQLVLELSPNHLICILDTATLYKNDLKNKDEAIKYFKKALEIYPYDEGAQDDLRSLLEDN